MLIEEVSRLEICMKEYNKVKVDLDGELEKAMGKIAELEAEIEVTRCVTTSVGGMYSLVVTPNNRSVC